MGTLNQLIMIELSLMAVTQCLSPHQKNRPDSDRGPKSNRRLPRTRDGVVSEVSWQLIRPKSITILYCDFTLFIDIFHIKVLFLCCFGLFYIVYSFSVPKQQNQNSAVKSGYQVA